MWRMQATGLAGLWMPSARGFGMQKKSVCASRCLGTRAGSEDSGVSIFFFFSAIYICGRNTTIRACVQCVIQGLLLPRARCQQADERWHLIRKHATHKATL